MCGFLAKIGADCQFSFNIASRENITCDIFLTIIHGWCELGQNIFSLLNSRGLRTYRNCLKTTFLGSEHPKINVSNENSKWICPYPLRFLSDVNDVPNFISILSVDSEESLWVIHWAFMLVLHIIQAFERFTLSKVNSYLKS